MATRKLKQPKKKKKRTFVLDPKTKEIKIVVTDAKQ